MYPQTIVGQGEWEDLPNVPTAGYADQEEKITYTFTVRWLRRANRNICVARMYGNVMVGDLFSSLGRSHISKAAPGLAGFVLRFCV